MITIKQMKAARLFLDWEQRDLASRSGLSLATVQRMEKLGVERSQLANVMKVKRTFEAAGVEFVRDGSDKNIGIILRGISDEN